MIGEVLGERYELLEKIGEGGMAIVYKARDRKLDRLVAVKILKKEFANNKDVAEKFKKEATAVANFSNSNIVNVLDVGHEEDGNVDYFVMEYINGKTLKEFIKYNGKLSYTTAINIAIKIAKALECAHGNNIICNNNELPHSLSNPLPKLCCICNIIEMLNLKIFLLQKVER